MKRAQISRLSKHFVRRWEQRVGGSPSVAHVQDMINESFVLRKQLKCMVRRAGILMPHKVLSEYWHHERGVIILVDEDKETAVTIYTAGGGR